MRRSYGFIGVFGASGILSYWLFLALWQECDPAAITCPGSAGWAIMILAGASLFVFVTCLILFIAAIRYTIRMARAKKSDGRAGSNTKARNSTPRAETGAAAAHASARIKDYGKADPIWNVDADAALRETEWRIEDSGQFWGGSGGHFRALTTLPRNIAKATGTHFSFTDTNISDISAVSQRPNIRSLELSENISDISVLSQLPLLEGLVAYKAPLKDISVLRHCTALSKLQLNVEDVADLSPLADLPNLESVELWNYRGQPLWPDARIKYLSFPRSKGVVIDLDPIASWRDLLSLSLNGGLIKGALPALSKVKHLSISGCNDFHFAVLSGYEALEGLFASDSDVNDLSPLAHCKLLKTASLSNMPITTIDALLSLPHLQDVDVSDSNVTEITQLSYLPELRSLRAANTPCSTLSGWNPGSNVSSLSIDKTLITDLSPLAGTSVRFLNLNHTPICELEPISRMPKLSALLISGTKVDSLKHVLEHPRLLHDTHADQREHTAWSLSFADTPVARSNQKLTEIAMMEDRGFNNKQKALRELFGIKA